MQDAAWASVAIAALALAFTVVSLLLRTVIRRAGTDATERAELRHLAQDVAGLARSNAQQLTLLREEIKDDRRATDRRLRWLEEHLWKT